MFDSVIFIELWDDISSFFATFARCMKRRIVFVLNPISGTASKKDIPNLIAECLDEDRFDYTFAQTEYAGHAYELATQAKDAGADVVVAIGGDGTVNEVARALRNSPTALGIIPCGSGNGLARHLLLPMNLKKAIGIINRCEIRALDYGVINGHPFFCTCGMGFDAYISMKFSEAGKRGPVTYLENILREGLRYKPETYEIHNEHGIARHKAFLISCANASQYGNNAYIAPQASMSDGLLDIIIMEPFDAIDAPHISIDMFNKTLDKSAKIKTFKSKKLHIHRQQEGVIHVDGDPILETADVEIELVEKGINMIVNPDGDKSLRKPNSLQSATAELFNELYNVKGDINKQTRHIQALRKLWQKKFNF